MHIRVPRGCGSFQRQRRGGQARRALRRQARRRVRLQLDEARISRDGDRRPVCGAVSVGAGNVKVYVTITHQASANQLAQTATKEYDYFTDTFGLPPTPAHQHRRAARRYSARRLRAGAGGNHGIPHRRQIRHPPAGQYHRPPVVGTAKSARRRSTTPGSPTACPATAS